MSPGTNKRVTHLCLDIGHLRHRGRGYKGHGTRLVVGARAVGVLYEKNILENSARVNLGHTIILRGIG